MKSVSQLAVTLLLGLCAGNVYAQVGNSCTGEVGSPVQGAHAGAIVAASATPVDGLFWPPNHKLRTVTISAHNSNGDQCDVTITDVQQDEAVVGTGSGNTTPDAANCSNKGNESSVDLRGEREGGGTGRFYTITYKMKDPAFPVQDKTGTATLLVPHDQGTAHFGTYVNEGPVFGSDGSDDMSISCSS
jgi:hypothetical protein